MRAVPADDADPDDGAAVGTAVHRERPANERACGRRQPTRHGAVGLTRGAAQRAGARRLHAGSACCRSTTNGGMVSVLVRDPARPGRPGHQGRTGNRARPVHRRAGARHARRWTRSSLPGNRVVAVATRPAADAQPAGGRPTSADCAWPGLLVFLDPPKHDAARSRWAGWPASASRSRSSPATTRPSPPRSAATLASASGQR